MCLSNYTHLCVWWSAIAFFSFCDAQHTDHDFATKHVHPYKDEVPTAVDKDVSF